jgi:hypothetical protein
MKETKSFQLVGQCGEFLAGLELIRRGYQVRIFGGTFPGIDLLAIDKNSNQFPIQVKTIRKGGAWQFNATKFIRIRFAGKTQVVEGPLKLGNINLINIFVKLIDIDRYKAEYFLISRRDLQNILIHNYKRWLEIHNGIRPKKPESTHCAIGTEDLEAYRDNWKILRK